MNNHNNGATNRLKVRNLQENMRVNMKVNANKINIAK